MSEQSIHRTETTIHWPSVIQVGLSLAGALIFWVLAAVLGLMVINDIRLNSSLDTGSETFALLFMVVGIVFAGVLLLPSAGFGLLRIFNKPNPIQWRLRHPGWLLLVVLVLIGLGYLAARVPALSWTVLPFIHVSVIGLSVLWLVLLGTRGLSLSSEQRTWGIFNSGMVLAPLLSLLAEAFIILGIVTLSISYLAQDPYFAEEFGQIADSFLRNPDQPPDMFFDFLEPYLMGSGTIYLLLLVAAVFVPLIEEFFKPIGVWFLAGKHITPAQGFAAGVLSGAGFAMFETLALSASSGEGWGLVAITRIGTSIIHIVTTGITGWALAQAWRERDYVRLGFAYLLSVSIHALWNGLVVLTVIPEFWPDVAGYPKLLADMGMRSLPVFAVLLVGGFALLIGCNAHLRRAIIPQVSPGTSERENLSGNFEK